MKFKLENLMMKLIVILICCIVFAESYFDTSIFIVMCICILGVRLIVRNHRRLSIANICILTIIFLLCVTLFILPIHKKTIMIVLKTCCLLLIEMSLEREKEWGIDLTIIFRNLSFLFVITTLIQAIMPSLIDFINRIILSDQGLLDNRELYRNMAYAGITAQTGTNSFYIVIYIIITFVNVFFLKKKQYISLIIGIVALWLTAKRAPFIFCVLTILLLIAICSNNVVKTILQITKYSAFLFLGIIILYNIIPEMSAMINKIFYMKDISSGRFSIYSNILEISKTHPILGNGVGIISEKLGVGAHNIYLMLWCELGLILGTIIILIMLGRLVGTIVNIKKKYQISGDNPPIRYMYSLAIQMYILMYGFTGNVLTETSQLMTYLVFCALIKDEKFIKEKYKGEKSDRKNNF